MNFRCWLFGSLILPLLFSTAEGQRFESAKAAFPEFQFGKFPDSLFGSTFTKRFAGQDFIYVFKDYKADVNYAPDKGFSVSLRISERGKFLTDKGFGFGLYRIQFYNKQQIEEIDSIKIVVQTKAGKRIELQPENIQSIELSDTWKMLQFAVPFAEADAVFDVSYKIRRQYMDELPDFKMQEPVPVLHAKATVRNSQYFVYRVDEKNVRFPLFHHIQYSDTSGRVRLFTDPAITYLKTETFYSSDIPALPDEPWTSGLERAQLRFIWSEFGRPRQVLESSWAFASADIAKRASFFGEEMPPLPPVSNQSKKQWRDVFFDIREAHIFDGADGIFPSREKIKETAGRAEINMDLIKALRKKGYSAFPGLAVDASKERLDINRASFLQFDALVAVLVLESDTLVLDAAQKNGFPGLLDDRFYGEPILAIRENGFFWVQNDRLVVDNRSLKFKMALSRDGQISGNVKVELNGNTAWKAVEQLRKPGGGTKEWAGLIFERQNLDAFKTSSIKIDSIDQKLSFEADFSVKNAAISFSDALDIFPVPIGLIEKSPFEATWRRSSIRMDRTRTIDVEIELKIPSGFRAPETMEAANFQIEGASISCEILESRRDLLRLRYRLTIDRWYFPPDQYAQVQAFFAKWVQISAMRMRITKG